MMRVATTTAQSRAPACLHCGRPAVLTTGAEVYRWRPALARTPFWACRPCGAWVGCHPGTREPLGRPADAPTRMARQKAHRAFDPWWKQGVLRRVEAYARLARDLGIAVRDCHVAEFDIATCERVVDICREWSPEPRRISR